MQGKDILQKKRDCELPSSDKEFEHLAETFKDPDSDYHTIIASLVYNVPYESVTPKMRSDVKSFNLGKGFVVNLNK